MEDRSNSNHPLTRLSEDDLTLISEFVLASGSLKDLAKTYGVSYPTIRSRLNGLISRVGDVMAGRPPDPVAHTLADLVERGELSASGARKVLEAVKASQNGRAAWAATRHDEEEVRHGRGGG